MIKANTTFMVTENYKNREKVKRGLQPINIVNCTYYY